MEPEDDTTESTSEEDRIPDLPIPEHGLRRPIYIMRRPNTSDGYWLSFLMPMVYIFQSDESRKCKDSYVHRILLVASIGMFIESLCFFMYLHLQPQNKMKVIISLIPGLLTFSMCTALLQMPTTMSILLGFGITFLYQSFYIRIMGAFPKSFSFGEATILVQGLILFLLSSLVKLPHAFVEPPNNEFDEIDIIMTFALVCLAVACTLIGYLESFRKPLGFYILMSCLLIAVTTAPVTKSLPIINLLNFILKDRNRIIIIAFYLMLVGVTIFVIWWQLRENQGSASTRMRKLFHILIVLVYVPGLLYQCAFLYIASGVAFAILTIIELCRLLKIPPFARILNQAFSSFVDEKDSGRLALTPFCLLIGCSLPLWVHSCPCKDLGTHSEAASFRLFSGILAIGIGDTAASFFGSLYGRIRWNGSSRTLEGSIAFVSSIALFLYILNISGYLILTSSQFYTIFKVSVLSALMEAFLDQIDNLVLPLFFYACVHVD